MRRNCRTYFTFALPLFLAACAQMAPRTFQPEASPSAWQAPLPNLPHQGQLSGLRQWWQQWDDATLVTLIEAAQTAGPTLDAARARLDQAQASLQMAQAVLGPATDVSLSSNRGRQTTIMGTPIATVTQARVGATWETDLFGQSQLLRDAASLRVQGAQAAWHEARVSLAADVANLYLAQRACELTLAFQREDIESRAVTARLTQAQADAGFATASSAKLARSAESESHARLRQQLAICDTGVKGLVALTGLTEPELRRQLAASRQSTTQSLALAVETIPAKALTQRPDVFQAERQVAAASAELGSAQAERYPRLTLNGAVGQMNLRLGGSNIDLSTWSVGPITLSVPLWDNGRFAAHVAESSARYDEAAANYRAKARQAVREVEEALVQLHSARERLADLQSASEGYRALLNSVQQRQQHGLASVGELEETRRSVLAAQAALVGQQRDTQQAWVALYRAVGGGWSPDTLAVPAQSTAKVTAP
ncbi:MAG: efflux transporter outer membrane subunit [Burkholderiaceae bacterium]|jgi:multidrug efflux system outer membrane protein|nr:efflux transporter outer membrane subunit [Burkholderiaceae bacterium]